MLKISRRNKKPDSELVSQAEAYDAEAARQPSWVWAVPHLRQARNSISQLKDNKNKYLWEHARRVESLNLPCSTAVELEAQLNYARKIFLKLDARADVGGLAARAEVLAYSAKHPAIEAMFLDFAIGSYKKAGEAGNANLLKPRQREVNSHIMSCILSGTSPTYSQIN